MREMGVREMDEECDQLLIWSHGLHSRRWRFQGKD